MIKTTACRSISSFAIVATLLTAASAPANEENQYGPTFTRSTGVERPFAYAPSAPVKRATATTTWTSYPLFAGEMTSIAAHPTDPDTAWVGTRDAGVFKTVDGGQTWTPSREGLTFFPIRSLVVDPVLPARLYAGTDFNGVWKSIDGGSNWFSSSTGIDDLFIMFNIIVDPTNTNIVYASGFGGVANVIGAVYRSTDAGTTWTRADTGIAARGDTWVNGIKSLAIDPGAPSTLYAGTTFEGIFRTTSGGAVWTAINDGVPWLAEPDWRKVIDALAVDHHHGGRPSAVISTLGYYVLDPSDLWQELSDAFLGGRRMIFHPTVSDVVMMAGGGYFLSTDGGITWNGSGPLTVDIALRAGEPDTLLGARRVGYREPGGVYRSTDAGGTWSWSGDGVTAQAVRSVATDPNDSNRLFAGTGHGFLSRSTDGGVTWTRATEVGDPTEYKFGFEVKDVAVDPSDSNRVFLSAGRLYRSLDGGATFAYSAPITSSHTIEITPDGAAIYVGCGSDDGVFKSTDGGDSWFQVNTGLPTFGDKITPILSIAVDPSNHQTVWAGTQYGGGIVKSTDGGLNWQVMGLTEDNFVFSIAVNPEDGNDILAGGGFGEGALYRSTDGGQSWTTILDNIAFVHDMIHDPLYPGHLYAATEGEGIWRSIDGGATWTDYSDGIFYPLLYSLDISPDRRLITGSYGSGIYWMSLPPDPATVIFADGFETGDTSEWSSTAP
jgi:photosystem II stability/assembly factor-like uncharacterized protein